MHEGDSRDGGAQIRPPGPSDRPAPAAGNPAAGNPAAGNPAAGNPAARNPAARNPAARNRAPGRFRRWLTFLVVAALSAAAGVGATRAVQHLTAPDPAAAGMPGTAAERPGTLNAEAVYQAVEPGVV